VKTKGSVKWEFVLNIKLSTPSYCLKTGLDDYSLEGILQGRRDMGREINCTIYLVQLCNY
jgi:hypothetical protein